jgi:hypothetical protein
MRARKKLPSDSENVRLRRTVTSEPSGSQANLAFVVSLRTKLGTGRAANCRKGLSALAQRRAEYGKNFI